jgi:hypothetical protein
MVLKILHAVGSIILPEKYYTHAVLAVVAVITLYTFAQGRKTSRERDLHGRTILITAGSYLEDILPGADWLPFLREPSPPMGLPC